MYARLLRLTWYALNLIRKKEAAEGHKSRGNEFYKRKEYKQALACYSTAIGKYAQCYRFEIYALTCYPWIFFFVFSENVIIRLVNVQYSPFIVHQNTIETHAILMHNKR